MQHKRKIFTEEYKLSPKQYLTEVRINKAKQLLTDGFLKINAVAAQCGFTNQYHFSRIFKEKPDLHRQNIQDAIKFNKYK